MTGGHRAAAVSLLVAIAGTRAAAQTPSQPRLYLSVFGGYRAGRSFWTLNGQPIQVLYASGDTTVASNMGSYDTLNLERQIAPGFVVGVSGTYFASSHLGFGGELAFFGLDQDSRCEIHQAQPADAFDVAPDACTVLNSQTVASGAVGVAVHAVGRMTAGKGVFPYVRASAGVIARDRGTIAMEATFFDANSGQDITARVIADRSPRNINVQLGLAAGLALSVGPGYEIRIEGRDLMTMLDRVTGLADPNTPTGALDAPRAAHLFHNFALSVGLDVIFERTRGHRY